MACFHPLRAYRTRSGTVGLGKELPDSHALQLPCGGCLGCRQDKAREWALRCHLELQEHRHAVFTTLTYRDDDLPEFRSLERTDLQLWLKRLRKRIVSEASRSNRYLRFFACGEYGETNHRPHYHAILYGISERDADAIHETWGKGHTQTVPVTPATIAYTAGYTAKKIGWKFQRRLITDPDTGEVLYAWEPPFIQMSRGGRTGAKGIASSARVFTNSWRSYAIYNGRRIPVPRYLHQAWKDQASIDEIEQLEMEKEERARKRINTPESRAAAEKHAIKRQELAGLRRSL